MWNRQELKMRGKMAFQANYGSAVAVALLMGIISSFFGGGSGVNTARMEQNTDPYSQGSAYGEYGNLNYGILMGVIGAAAVVMGLIGTLLTIFVESVLQVGGCRFFIQNQTGRPGIGTMLDGFRSGHYGNIVLTMFLRNLFITLWSLLLVVPGIIKSYEYMMVPYILAENPGMDRREAFQISKQMMDGQKWEAFVLDLSFLGWHLLSVFTCGLLEIFFVAPYLQATYAELYAFNKMRGYQEGFIR